MPGKVRAIEKTLVVCLLQEQADFLHIQTSRMHTEPHGKNQDIESVARVLAKGQGRHLAGIPVLSYACSLQKIME